MTPEQAAFNAALAAFQAEIPSVGKDQTAKVPTKAGGSYSYDYADLTAIVGKALPLLSKHGLSFMSFPTLSEHGFVLRFSLRHCDGHVEDGFYPLPDPSRSSPQEIGSAITYGRRYTLCAATGIAPGGEDDDGQKAAEARAAAPSSRRAQVPLAEAKARVWKASQALGWDAADLRMNFARDNDNAILEDATLDDLTAFAVKLEMLPKPGEAA